MPRVIWPCSASQPPSSSTPTWPERRDRPCSAEVYLACSRTTRIRLARTASRGPPLELVDLAVLLAEALDHPDAGDRRLDLADQLAGLLLGVPVGREQVAPRARGDEPQRRRDRPARPGSAAARARPSTTSEIDEQQRVAGQHRQERQQPLHQADVGDRAADHLAGLQARPGRRRPGAAATVKTSARRSYCTSSDSRPALKRRHEGQPVLQQRRQRPAARTQGATEAGPRPAGRAG